MTVAILQRLAAMDRRQAAFRLRGEIRKWRERAALTLSAPRWNPSRLSAEMREQGASSWNVARLAIRDGDRTAAHLALAQHFSERSSAFPLDTRDLGLRAATIAARYPAASTDAARRGDAIAAGSYDLLGYQGIHIPAPIDWHSDPVHQRRMPMAHWSAVGYLDPEYGDHKIIWELNRHQHWLALGRAYALTGRRQYYETFRDQLRGWMAANPPLGGANWASMLELGFRTLSWLWAIAFFAGEARHDARTDAPWLPDALLGLTEQLDHIERNLSRYFSPNTHLTGEALALYVAGCALPELESSARWQAIGREVLLREAHAQVRPDGGHAELSGHYHRYSTDFYLLALAVARRAGDPAAPALEHTARAQSHYLRTIADDRGRRPATGDDDGGQLFPIAGRSADDCRDTLAIAAILFNEPALAVDGVPEEAVWVCGDAATRQFRAAPAAWTSTALPDTGYFVSRTADGDHLLFDAGPHGFLNGGHAHADALSIVLTVAGRPLLVDPGTATYTMDPEVRDRFRDSAMHNTLTLDRRPQSVPRGPFHWQARTSARANLWRSIASAKGSSPHADYVEGTHDGYLPARHTRSVLALHGIGWWVLDHVIGAGDASLDVYWHLHPAWRATMREGRAALRHEDGSEIALASTAPLRALAPGSDRLAVWSPAYGRIEPAPLVIASARSALPCTLATFIAARPGYAPDAAVECVTLASVPAGWHAGAWRVSWDGGSSTLLAAIEIAADGLTREDSAAPESRWGTADLTTDARIAAVVAQRGDQPGADHGRHGTVVVNGSAVWRREAARSTVDNLASPVHVLGPAEVGTH